MRLHILLVILLPLLLIPAMAEPLLLREDFDQPGDFGKLIISHPNVKLLRNGGRGGSDAIRVFYVGSKEGSERVLARFPLARPVKEATLCFDVRFGENFKWVRGGKLHGLGPKDPVTGGDPREPNKWSARLMFKRGGRSMSYLYEQGVGEKYGVGDTSLFPVFKRGVWQRVTMLVKLNTPGKSDGTFSIYMDNKRTNLQNAVRFRATSLQQTEISKMLFHTFHGGHTPRYAPKDSKGKYITVFADFDNFSVREGLWIPAP